MAGSGDIHIRNLTAGSATASISGSGDIELGGKADSLASKIAGSGDVKAGKLETKSSTVSIAGSGMSPCGQRKTQGFGGRGSGDVQDTGIRKSASRLPDREASSDWEVARRQAVPDSQEGVSMARLFRGKRTIARFPCIQEVCRAHDRSPEPATFSYFAHISYIVFNQLEFQQLKTTGKDRPRCQPTWYDPSGSAICSEGQNHSTRRQERTRMPSADKLSAIPSTSVASNEPIAAASEARAVEKLTNEAIFLSLRTTQSAPCSWPLPPGRGRKRLGTGHFAER